MDKEKEYHKSRLAFYIDEDYRVNFCEEPLSHVEWFKKLGLIDSLEDLRFERILRGNIRKDKIEFYIGKSFNSINIADDKMIKLANIVLTNAAIKGKKYYTDSIKIKVCNGVLIGKPGQLWESKRICGYADMSDGSTNVFNFTDSIKDLLKDLL